MLPVQTNRISNVFTGPGSLLAAARFFPSFQTINNGYPTCRRLSTRGPRVSAAAIMGSDFDRMHMPWRVGTAHHWGLDVFIDLVGIAHQLNRKFRICGADDFE